MGTTFRLAALLKRRGMSLRELSRLSGISYVTVWSMAHNRTKMARLETLDAVAAALGVKPGDLIEREPAKGGKRRGA